MMVTPGRGAGSLRGRRAVRVYRLKTARATLIRHDRNPNRLCNPSKLSTYRPGLLMPRRADRPATALGSAGTEGQLAPAALLKHVSARRTGRGCRAAPPGPRPGRPAPVNCTDTGTA